MSIPSPSDGDSTRWQPYRAPGAVIGVVVVGDEDKVVERAREVVAHGGSGVLIASGSEDSGRIALFRFVQENNAWGL